MIKSRSRPNKPGYYWVRCPPNKEVVVYVDMDYGVFAPGFSKPFSFDQFETHIVEWLGKAKK